jgi:hypothetical protein
MAEHGSLITMAAANFVIGQILIPISLVMFRNLIHLTIPSHLRKNPRFGAFFYHDRCRARIEYFTGRDSSVSIALAISGINKSGNMFRLSALFAQHWIHYCRV